MTRCPHCFQELSADRYLYACVSGRCERAHDPAASAYRGTSVSTTPVVPLVRPQGARGWTAPPQVPCHTCRGPAQQVCPACHWQLLPGWREARATCLAMAGARATGKSCYVGVAVKEMEQMAEALGSTLEAVGPKTRQVYQDVYEKPLYEARGIMPPTPRADLSDAHQRDPLIFSLGVSGGVRRYVVLRDVAGEDLERLEGTPTHLRFFAAADGVLFLFDPLWVPEVIHQLEGLIPAPLRLGGDPRKVLSNVLALIGGASPRVAVVLSKFDALQALRDVQGTAWSKVMSNAGAAFSRDPGPLGPYDEEDGQLLHQEVRSLLQRLQAGSVVTAVENPNAGQALPHRFFAVSALGDSPRGESLSSRGISPFRCLDPIRWVMAASDLP